MGQHSYETGLALQYHKDDYTMSTWSKPPKHHQLISKQQQHSATRCQKQQVGFFYVSKATCFKNVESRCLIKQIKSWMRHHFYSVTISTNRLCKAVIVIWGLFEQNVSLLGQLKVLQVRRSSVGPSQGSPSKNGPLHSLLLDFSPPPQVTLQESHSDHCLHTPLTRTIVIVTLIKINGKIK